MKVKKLVYLQEGSRADTTSVESKDIEPGIAEATTQTKEIVATKEKQEPATTARRKDILHLIVLS